MNKPNAIDVIENTQGFPVKVRTKKNNIFLPVLSIIDKLEKKLNKVVLSSNQALIWDTLEGIGKNESIEGFGKLFKSN